MLHRGAVLPVRVTRDDLDLAVRVRHIVGYRFVCSCGERGKVRGIYAEARRDLSLHRAEVVRQLIDGGS